MSITGIGEVASLASNIVNKFWPDKSQTEKDAMALEIQEMTMASQERIAQMDVNKAEATNTSIFVAGWRPFVGWVCGFALAWDVIVFPLSTFVSRLMGYAGIVPQIDDSLLQVVLMGMLGLGAMRTVEKVKRINAGH